MIWDSFENKFLDCGGPTKCAQSPLFASIISSPFKVATQPAKKTSAHKVLPQIKPFRSREVWIIFFWVSNDFIEHKKEKYGANQKDLSQTSEKIFNNMKNEYTFGFNWGLTTRKKSFLETDGKRRVGF